MKIKSIRIQNFRAFKDETISFNGYTCLVGPNGAGKSTVLCALNLFFGATGESSVDLASLEEEDFFQRDTSAPITVTVTFCDLEPEAQKDFAAYYRQNELVISACATFNPESKRADVQQFGQRMAMKLFAPFFKAEGDGAKVEELKKIYAGLTEACPELSKSAKTKDAIKDALHEYEKKHAEKCELIPSQDQFYGVSKGTNRLEKYIQWVFVPAVKDVTTEQAEGKNTALAKLLARTVRSKTNFDSSIQELRSRTQGEYKSLLAKNQSTLEGISASLKTKLSNWAHPDANLRLEWRQDYDRAVHVDDPFAEIIAGEGRFEGKLVRFGHGFQRSYLLALLQELSGSGDAAGPRLILGVEEPELYQHPPQARHLAEVLKDLSTKNSQVMVCTHSPYFVSGEGFEDVRIIRKSRDSSEANVEFVTFDELAKTIAAAKGEAVPKPSGLLSKINQELQPHINEILFTPFLILVEGLEDVAYIAAYLHLMGKWDDYRKLGCHIVATNGKSLMVRPLGIISHLKIPTFTVLDSDGDMPDKNGSRVKHKKDNTAILKLCGIATPDPLPADTLWGTNVVMWKSNMGKVVEADIPVTELQKYQLTARQNCGQVEGLEKNALFIAEWLKLAWDGGHKSSTLERLCNEILKFATPAPTQAVAAVDAAPTATVI